MSAEPRLIQGGLAVDDRGELGFVNDFHFEGVKRFYTVTNFRQGFIRAWHGHKREAKFITAVHGAALACAVEVDNWESPSKTAAVHRFVLSGAKPAILHVPAGFANGLMTLTADAKLVIFSTLTLDESKEDDIRFPVRYWDPWTVEER